MSRIKGYVELTVRIVKEGDQWAAECIELGTATCGRKLEKVQEAIVDMIGLHLNALEDVGECARFLRKHGITFHRVKPRPRPHQVTVRPGELVTRISKPVLTAVA